MRGFADWTDLGVFPLQDVEDGVPVGTRMTLAAGRVASSPTPGSSSTSKLTEYAREDDLGTLGDVHPWHFWQTTERGERAMGSWAQAWASLVVEARDFYDFAGVLPMTHLSGDAVSDPRYKVAKPSWDLSLPWQPPGMLSLVMPTTKEDDPRPVMLSADRRLVAAAANGPGEAGTTIVDLDSTGALCIDGSENPGEGGRHARLQGLVRVIPLGQNSAPILGGSGLNGLALNFGLSEQDGILGYGMIHGPATDGGGATGSSGGSSPTTTVSTPAPSPGPNAGSSGFGSGVQRAPRDFGEFEPSGSGGNAVGFLHGAAGGPILHGCAKHQLGATKDGHHMTPAHVSTGALFYQSTSRDGPLEFGGEYPEVQVSEVPTAVHLAWDSKVDHSWIGGSSTGMWRWWTTVPYIRPTTGEPPTGGPPTPGPTTPNGPSGPATPGVPGRPATPGAGPGPNNPNGPGTPVGPQPPNAPGTPGSPTLPPLPGGAPLPPGSGPQTPPGPSRPVTPGAVPWPGWIYPEGPPPGWEEPDTSGPRTPPMPPGRPTTPGAGPPRPSRPITPGARPRGQETPLPQGDGIPGRGTGPEVSILDVFDPDAENRRRRTPGVVQTVGGASEDRTGLYGVFHPFHEAFAALSLRPQLWLSGAPNFERNPTLPAEVYRIEEQTRPHVLTARAWGAQDEGDWDYLQSPSASRPRGGLVNGGLLFAPPEFEMEDYLGINSRAATDSPTQTSYVALATGVCLAFGAPTTVSGGVADGTKTWAHDALGGVLTLSEVVSGAATGILSAEIDGGNQPYVDHLGTGATKLPVGTTAQRPSTPVAGMIRQNSTTGNTESYDGSSWNALGAGGGGGISAVVDDPTPQLGGPLDVNGQEIQSAADVVVQLGDAAGAQKFSLQDSASAEVFAVDSNGGLTLVAGSIATADLANNAVTAAKLEDIATQRFLGRNTAGLGDPETLTMATARTMLNVADGADVTVDELDTVTGDVVFASGVSSLSANSVGSAEIATGAVDTDELAAEAVTLAKMAQGSAGSILYYSNDGDGSGVPTTLAPGTDGQFLMSNGALAAPSYEDLPPASALEYGVIRGANANVTGQSGSTSYTQLTQLGTDVRSSANVTTSTADQITVGVAGLYRVSYSVTITRSGTAINNCQMGIAVGGTLQADGRSGQYCGVASQIFCLAASSVLSLSASDVITLQFKTNSATGNLIAYEANLSVELLPGQ